MNSDILQSHKNWSEKLLRTINPTGGMVRRSVEVSHGNHGLGVTYPATLHHPGNWILEDALESLGDAPSGVSVPERDEQGRWVSIHHRYDHYPVFVQNHPSGGTVISGGVGGRLNGLHFSGIKSDEDYRTHSRRSEIGKRDAEEQAQKVAELQQEQLVRGAEKEPGLTHEEHILPMTPEQALDFTRTRHHYSMAKIAQEKDEDFISHARRINPDTEDDNEPTNIERAYHDALMPILHGHEKGAKVKWLREFANEHRGEPLSVVAVHPQSARTADFALNTDGHSVSRIDPGDNPVAAHDQFLQWSHPSDGSRSNILVSGNERYAQNSGRPHHVVYMDSDPGSEPVEGKHLSSHVLKLEEEK